MVEQADLIHRLSGLPARDSQAAAARPDEARLFCQTHRAKQETAQAGAFLTWLADRGRTLGHYRQADLDAWHSEKPATRRPARTFPRWCTRTGRMPPPPSTQVIARTRRRCTITADSPCSGGP
ncbi:hypothetical protein ACF1G0_29790 [Streptomyces sp. NPDC013953]|uniref:hypothetical protein n=1 Tax=Streptomyces sp. NPDC013953 TaxID=3364868 RepID=UPI003701E58A